jgi:cyclopropane fatty-acyl-phospholipid synthase-like methyltransferase
VTFFDNAYEGTPTWDIGRPQPAVIRMSEAGDLEGTILDVGCGTGEDAMFLAERGHAVVGVDLAGAAIARAQATAAERGSAAAFVIHDALDLESLGQAFDTVLDVGCFHTLQPGDRRRYATSLRSALRPGGRARLLCWSDRNPFGYGPERVTRSAIRVAFRAGWSVESIELEVLETRLSVGQVHAWLARLRRT